MASSWRAQAVAAFVTFHLAVITFMALPSPGSGLQRSAWKEPVVQAEFAAWTGRLNALGWEGDQATFEDHLWSLATGVQGARDAVIDPLLPYFRFSGAWQSWKMFVAPHRFPSRLMVDVQWEADGPWETIYAPHDPSRAFLAEVLEHDRMRSAVFRYAWPNYRRTWRPFARWVAAEALAAHPDLHQVRVRYVSGRTPSPQEQLSGDLPETKDALVKRYTAASLRGEP